MTADRLSIQAIQAAYTSFAASYSQQTNLQSNHSHPTTSPLHHHLTTPPPHLPIPQNIHLFNQVPSTNKTLWQLLSEQASEQSVRYPAVAIAQEQTHGKGQRSRQWLSLPGGLYLSVAQYLDVAIHAHGLLSIATAWGIASVLDFMGVSIGLKWPNDLVIEGKKLGGILIETRLRGDRLSQAVIGVGMNWANPMPANGISLRSCLPEASPIQTLNDVAALVLLGIQIGITGWQRQGGEAIARAYEKFWINHGQHIPLPVPQGQSLPNSVGKMVGVNGDGYLIIQRQGDSESGFLTEVYAPGTIRVGYGSESNQVKK